jgi:predicted metal-dependent hydrolase
MAEAIESAITIRRVPLEFPPDLDPMVIEGCPEDSYTHVGLSLLLPYLEPYLIRSMRAAKEHVTDPKLLADLDAFNGQEGQHYRQHIRFNEAMHLQGFDKLRELESELDADYRRYSQSKSLRFNLAYAEGFEAFTMALARFSFESKAFDRLHPAARELFVWHLVRGARASHGGVRRLQARVRRVLLSPLRRSFRTVAPLPIRFPRRGRDAEHGP